MIAVQRHDIEAARRRCGVAPQEVSRREHQATLFGLAYALRRATVGATGTSSNFDKHQRAVALAQNQVPLAAWFSGASGHPIIALLQRQALTL